METKKCTRCGKVKTINLFSQGSTLISTDGVSPFCTECLEAIRNYTKTTSRINFKIARFWYKTKRTLATVLGMGWAAMLIVPSVLIVVMAVVVHLFKELKDMAELVTEEFVRIRWNVQRELNVED